MKFSQLVNRQGLKTLPESKECCPTNKQTRFAQSAIKPRPYSKQEF